MAPIAQTQKALKIQGPGAYTASECPIRQPNEDEILVKVSFVAINPIDPKSADLSPTPGATAGCDFSGIVVSVGPSVKKKLQIGDRVSGAVLGNNPDDLNNGSFAEYVAIPGDLVWKIPDSMSLQQASTLGVGMATVGLGLYQSLKLPLPNKPSSQTETERPGYVLVYGGGTATGTLAIQMIRL